MSSDEELRMACLRLAVPVCAQTGDDVVVVAERFYQWVMGEP